MKRHFRVYRGEREMRRIGQLFIVLSLVGGSLVAGGAAVAAETQPLTVTILETVDQGGNFDVNSPGDFYAVITIDGTEWQSPAQDFPSGVGIGYAFPFPISTDWVRTVFVDPGDTPIAVEIEIFDKDDEIFTGDDDPAGSHSLLVDLSTGLIGGDFAAQVDANITVPATDDTAGLTFRIDLADPADTDGDGLLDDWEVNGHPDGVDLPALGADPQRKDIFLEVDCLAIDTNGDGDYSDPGEHAHCPTEDAVELVVQSFADAPVVNVDGTTGIQLHVDVGGWFGDGLITSVNSVDGDNVSGTYGDLGGGGDAIAEAGNAVISLDPNSTNPDLWELKSMDTDRVDIFRYGLFAHQIDSGRGTNGSCTSGRAELPGNDFIVSLGGQRNDGSPCWGIDAAGNSVGNLNQQAGTLMHELGHTINLRHGGGDNDNRKPNYLSVMNYRNLLGLITGVAGPGAQSCGVPASTGGSITLPGGCDYSRVVVDLTEQAPGLDECAGIDIGGFLAFGAINFDGSVDDNDLPTITGATCSPPSANVVGVDINPAPGAPPSVSALPGHDDWNNVILPFRQYENFTDGVSDSSVLDYTPEDLEAAQDLVDQQTAPVLAAMITAPDAAVNGAAIDAEFEVTNVGAGPAFDLVAELVDPNGVVAAEVTSDELAIGESVSGAGSWTVPALACPGEFFELTADATATGRSLLAYTGSTSHTIGVLDEEAPTIEVTLDPAVLWPPTHDMRTIRATVVAEDRCGEVTVTLDSIVSSEPDDGIGDGSTSGDIRGASFGTDDRTFELRAERSGSNTRVYTVTFTATDESGNQTSVEDIVTVPATNSLRVGWS